MKCPIGIPRIVRICEVCIYSKQGLCDYPYYKGMTKEEMEKVNKK